MCQLALKQYLIGPGMVVVSLPLQWVCNLTAFIKVLPEGGEANKLTSLLDVCDIEGDASVLVVFFSVSCPCLEMSAGASVCHLFIWTNCSQ